MRVPPLNSARARKGLIAGVRRARWARARAFETLGSDRYSATATGGMDRFLAGLIGENGYFIEAGANDGFRQSNTYLLERFHGWSGVLVEPIPSLYKTCAKRRAARVVNAALVDDPALMSVSMTFADLNSVVGEDRASANWGWTTPYEVEVPARTLTEILEEARAPAAPDLLSLDIEGHEVQALAGLDFDRYAPSFLLLEAWGGLEQFDGLLDDYELHCRFSDKDVLLTKR